MGSDTTPETSREPQRGKRPRHEFERFSFCSPSLVAPVRSCAAAGGDEDEKDEDEEAPKTERDDGNE
ncbi:uncharacterized protein V6R79_019188 [Siganus canaliculatus]